MEHSTETNSKEMLARVDDFGRAYAGSQRQIQTYVNLRPLELSNKVLAQLSLPPPPQSQIQWVSPLASKKFAEYSDEEFLNVLGLEKYSSDLRGFWPHGGPSWDALGTLESPMGRGVVLVEAKSHVTELQSDWRARSPESRRKIGTALAETKNWLRIPDPDSLDWTKFYYQAANRYAHLYFLRSKGIDAWLANIYFLSDPHFKDPPPPHSPREWEPAIDAMNQALGLRGIGVSYTGKVFLEASEGH